jgi:protein-tyrosine-phosphatase
MTEVLVCCHGAICRSPLAVAVMKRAGITSVQAAGFKAPSESGKRSPKKIRDWAMQNEGIDLGDHRSQTVTADMIREARILLYMDSGQYGRLQTMWQTLDLGKDCGAIDARCRPLGMFLIKPQARIGDPMFQRPETAEFLNIMHQLVEASTRFASYWLESSMAAAPQPATEPAVESVTDEYAGIGDAAEEAAA